MLRLLMLWAGMGLAVSLQAAAIKLDTMKVGDMTYSNVTITSFSATDVYFSHAKGVSNAKIRNLEPSVQKLLEYDPAAAQAAEQQQQAGERIYEGALAKAVGSGAAANRARESRKAMEEHFADPVSDRSLLGKRGPNLEVDKWLTDRPELEGKFLLVSFWSTKSPAARKWIPQLNSWQKKFKTKLQTVALSAEPEAEVLAVTEPKIEFASALDSSGKLMNSLGITSVPYVLLLDPKGTVLYYGHPAALNEQLLQATLSKTVE